MMIKDSSGRQFFSVSHALDPESYAAWPLFLQGAECDDANAVAFAVKRQNYTAAITQHAEKLRQTALANTSAQQRDGWGQKADTADLMQLQALFNVMREWLEALDAESRPDGFDAIWDRFTQVVEAKKAALAVEASLVGETLGETADKVISRGAAFQTVANTIEGMQRKALKAIDEAADDELDAVFASVKAEAAEWEKQLGLGEAGQ